MNPSERASPNMEEGIRLLFPGESPTKAKNPLEAHLLRNSPTKSVHAERTSREILDEYDKPFLVHNIEKTPTGKLHGRRLGTQTRPHMDDTVPLESTDQTPITIATLQTACSQLPRKDTLVPATKIDKISKSSSLVRTFTAETSQLHPLVLTPAAMENALLMKSTDRSHVTIASPTFCQSLMTSTVDASTQTDYDPFDNYTVNNVVYSLEDPLSAQTIVVKYETDTNDFVSGQRSQEQVTKNADTLNSPSHGFQKLRKMASNGSLLSLGASLRALPDKFSLLTDPIVSLRKHHRKTLDSTVKLVPMTGLSSNGKTKVSRALKETLRLSRARQATQVEANQAEVEESRAEEPVAEKPTRRILLLTDNNIGSTEAPMPERQPERTTEKISASVSELTSGVGDMIEPIEAAKALEPKNPPTSELTPIIHHKNVPIEILSDYDDSDDNELPLDQEWPRTRFETPPASARALDLGLPSSLPYAGAASLGIIKRKLIPKTPSLMSLASEVDEVEDIRKNHESSASIQGIFDHNVGNEAAVNDKISINGQSSINDRYIKSCKESDDQPQCGPRRIYSPWALANGVSPQECWAAAQEMQKHPALGFEEALRQALGRATAAKKELQTKLAKSGAEKRELKEALVRAGKNNQSLESEVYKLRFELKEALGNLAGASME